MRPIVAPGFVLVLALIAAPAAGADLDREARAILEDYDPRIRFGLWVGGPSGEARDSVAPEAVLPTASAIKTAYLIEFFARYAGDLDRVPPGLADVLKDDHPAVAHFSPEQRDEIRRGLADASARRLGEIMMGSAPAPNVVYNAAANAITGLLGGPEALTRLIRDRDPAFAAIAVRRYMLADRRTNGDNEATPAALAAVLQRLAAREVPGLDPATVEAVRRAVVRKDDARFGVHSYKDGALTSDPITSVRAGWYEPAEGPPIVYVAMTALADPGDLPRGEAQRRLAEASRRLGELLAKSPRDPSR